MCCAEKPLDVNPDWPYDVSMMVDNGALTMPIPDSKILEIRRDGARAYHNGVQDNPYDGPTCRQTVEWHAWENGYADAMLEVQAVCDFVIQRRAN